MKNGYKSPMKFEQKLLCFMKLHFQRMHSQSAKIKIHPGQVNVLICILHNNGATQKELCSRLKIRAGSMTELLKRLEVKGLVLRRFDPDDRRKIRVFLTEEGKNLVHEAGALSGELERTYLTGFSEEEISQLSDFFDRMIENLIRTEEQPTNKETEAAQ